MLNIIAIEKRYSFSTLTILKLKKLNFLAKTVKHLKVEWLGLFQNCLSKKGF